MANTAEHIIGIVRDYPSTSSSLPAWSLGDFESRGVLEFLFARTMRGSCSKVCCCSLMQVERKGKSFKKISYTFLQGRQKEGQRGSSVLPAFHLGEQGEQKCSF